MTDSTPRRSRASRPRALPRGAVTELAAHVIELVLAEDDATVRQVCLNAHIPELHTHNPRQVDIYLDYEHAGRRFVRTVEVRSRNRPSGPQWVDEAEGKAQAIGAHRTTLVSTAGFTRGALDRVRAKGDLLDAVHLRPAVAADWPFTWESPSICIDFGSESTVCPLQARAYCDATTDRVRKLILYGEYGTNRSAGFVAFVGPASDQLAPGELVNLEPFFFGTGEAPPTRDSRLRLNFITDDGKTRVIERRGMPVTSLGSPLHPTQVVSREDS